MSNKPSKPKSDRQRWLSMSADELVALGEKYSKAPRRPLTPAERVEHDGRMAKVRRGRPTVGAGAKRLAISIERGLLTRLDAAAHAAGVKRSEAISRALKLWFDHLDTERRRAS